MTAQYASSALRSERIGGSIDTFGLVLALVISLSAGVAAADIPIVPRITAPPIINGLLDDACWTTARSLQPFGVPLVAGAPAKHIDARICSDADALYIGITCDEPEPAKLVRRAAAHGGEVWRDDCVEVFLRTTGNSNDIDHLIVSASGAQDEARMRLGRFVTGWRPTWQAAAAIGTTTWSAEIRIPATLLELDCLRLGDAIELKVGREDQVSNTLAIWPAGSRYGGADDLGMVVIEADNLIANADLSDRSSWFFPEGQADRFHTELNEGAKIIAVSAPGGETMLSQDIRVRPGNAYRFGARVLAPGPLRTRLRTSAANAAVDEHVDINLEGSPEWQTITVTVIAGADGICQLSFTIQAKSPAKYAYSDVVLAPIATEEALGDAIPLTPGEVPTRIEKVLVSDCRAVRGFLGAPVDGTLASGRWDGFNWEYPDPQSGQGILYSYLSNDGLHLTFADALGFDAVIVRGGIRANLVADARWNDPKAGSIVHRFIGHARSSRALLPKRHVGDKISFWNVSDGRIADCSFFRIESGAGPLPAPELHGLGDIVAPPEGLLAFQLAARFSDADRSMRSIASDTGGSAPWPLPAGHAVHLLVPAVATEQAIAAIGFDAQVDGAAGMSISIQDPSDPRLELHGADYRITAAGRIHLICDHPDQVVAPGHPLWITVRSDRAVTLSSVKIEIYRIPREQAEVQALAHRLLLLKSFYANLSEARPWTNINKPGDEKTLFAKTDKEMGRPWRRLQPFIEQLFETIATCRYIDREGHNAIVRQYQEWVFRKLPDQQAPIPAQTNFDAIPGVPEWASIIHQAWMLSREVPKWWLENRMVPNGELGGEVQDDTDMFGNYIPFPMFERDGVGGMILRAGAELADTADRQNLTHGINRQTTDPLHAYEEGINHEAIMTYWNYGDPLYFERSMAAAKSMETLTAVTPQGHRHFRTEMIGVADLDNPPAQAYEDSTHPLMLHPSMEVAWYNRHPRVLALLKSWGDGWLDHLKPGAYATQLAFGDNETVSTSNEAPFTGFYGFQGAAFMFLADVLDDPRYVRPFNDWFEKGKNFPSAGHAGEMVQSGLLSSAPAALAAVASRWDVQLYTTGAIEPMIIAVKKDIVELQRFPHMYTTCECFTDRVFMSPIYNAAIAYTGGLAFRNKINHTFAISWEGFGTDYAALVTAANRTGLTARICNISDRSLNGLGRVWRLGHGKYEVKTGIDRNDDGRIDTDERLQTKTFLRGDTIDLTLPAKSVVILEIKLVEALGEWRNRPDLALSARELIRSSNAVSVKVHNIGIIDAPATTIVLRNPEKVIVQTKTVPAIAAPLDLDPRVVTVAFDQPGDLTGWTISADPEDAIPEICTANNTVTIGH